MHLHMGENRGHGCPFYFTFIVAAKSSGNAEDVTDYEEIEVGIPIEQAMLVFKRFDVVLLKKTLEGRQFQRAYAGEAE